MNNKKEIPENCLECEHHKVVADPDPDDWFNYDDVALLCLLTTNGVNNDTKYISDRYPHKCVTISSRPHRIRTESNRPSWCPLKNK